MNYFALFDLPTDYNIDIKMLSSRFQDLRRQNHPDKFINKTQEEQISAVLRFASINQAWQTLRDPLTRAEYLLSLHGIDLVNEQDTVKDIVFLTKQLDLYEELERIKYDRNSKLLRSFINHVRIMFDIQHQQMVEQLNNKMWVVAADSARKLNFLKKIQINAEQFEEKLLDFNQGEDNCDLITN